MKCIYKLVICGSLWENDELHDTGFDVIYLQEGENAKEIIVW